MVTAAVFALGRPTFDVGLGASHAKFAIDVLDRMGVCVVGDPNIIDDPPMMASAIEPVLGSKISLVVVLQATFTDARPHVALAEASDAPIVVWSFPEARSGHRLRLNSLCGANLAAYSLRRRHHRCAFVHVDPTSCDAPRRVDHAIELAMAGSAADTRQIDGVTDVATTDRLPGLDDPVLQRRARHLEDDLRARRVGVIGSPPDGFEPCTGDDAAIESTFGVHVEHLGLDDLFAAALRAPAGQVASAMARVERTMEMAPDVADGDRERSIRLYCGLRELADDHRLAALATRCWPECMTEFGGAACTPQAMMTEDGVPGVCEADVLGATTALMLQTVSDTEPFVADLVDLDDNDDTSVLWHCGLAAAGLADAGTSRVGTVHPYRRRALINEFALKPGRVTIARLSQAGSTLSLVIAGGEMLARPRPFDGTCGVLRWDLPVGDVVSTIFDRGIEHHLGVVYGDHRDVLVELARRWGLPVIRLGHEPGHARPPDD